MTSKQAGHDLKRVAIGKQGPTGGSRDAQHSEDPRIVARELMIEFGPEAVGIALGRAERALDADDGEGFQVWLDVVAAIQHFEALRGG